MNHQLNISSNGIASNITRKCPKNPTEIQTIDDIVEDLRYLTNSFPEAAIEKSLDVQAEITPLLLNFLQEVINNYKSIDDLFFGHCYALFLLAYFREKAAYPLIIKILSLPDDWPEILLSDIITEKLANILASVYDSDTGLIYTIIENTELNCWSRSAALQTLLVLVKNGILKRSEVISYFRELFPYLLFKRDMDGITYLVSACCDLYPLELYEQIQTAFHQGLVDEFVVDIEWANSVLTKTPEVAWEEFQQNTDYDLINRVDINSLSDWACYGEENTFIENKIYPNYRESELIVEDFEDDYPVSLAPYLRDTPKIGRNNPCPCNSGKKYKKCCISVD